MSFFCISVYNFVLYIGQCLRSFNVYVTSKSMYVGQTVMSCYMYDLIDQPMRSCI